MSSSKGILPALMALSFMWGSAHIFLKISSEDTPPILGIVCAYRKELTINRTVIRDMLAIGTLNGWLPNCLAALAITSISSAEAGILRTTTPIITGVSAALLLRDEQLSTRTIISLITGFIGVTLVVSSAFDPSSLGSIEGYLLMLGVSTSFGLGMVYGRWARPEPPALIATGQLLFATLVAFILSWAMGEEWSLNWDGQTTVSILMLGIFSTALPAIVFLTIISKYKAVKVGVTAFLQPVWAVILGYLFLGETILWVQVGGTLIIIFSVLVVSKSER